MRRRLCRVTVFALGVHCREIQSSSLCLSLER